MKGEAVLSECETYRAWLTRELGGVRPLVSIGANPSVADAMKDDQTIRKEQAYARLWSCGRLIKVNPYAYRATDANNMWEAEARGVDIVGTDIRGLHNDEYILAAIAKAVEYDGIVLGAWGKIPKPDRIAEMLRKIKERFPAWWVERGLACLGTNGDGSPKHTLYLKLDLTPERWVPTVLQEK